MHVEITPHVVLRVFTFSAMFQFTSVPARKLLKPHYCRIFCRYFLMFSTFGRRQVLLVILNLVLRCLIELFWQLKSLYNFTEINGVKSWTEFRRCWSCLPWCRLPVACAGRLLYMQYCISWFRRMPFAVHEQRTGSCYSVTENDRRWNSQHDFVPCWNDSSSCAGG